ncbi:MAG: hypothetical protein ABFD64_06730 [Armatimonadota bacterium]
MEAVTVDEEVRVGAAFDNRKICPVWFLWRSRYYRVRRVTYNWRSSLGIEKLYYFAVTVASGSSVYELCFNSGSLEWTLSRISGGDV